MPQGNPFGPEGGRWMTTAKLRALFNAGLTYDEIAEANERSEGWRPNRATVKRKYEAMGMPPRKASHRDLIPWTGLEPEHKDSVLRHMLQAESRYRQGKKLSDTDRKLTSRLHELLFGRGTLMVVGYDPRIGFYTAPREDSDEDIIRTRKPHARWPDPIEQAIWDVATLSEDERYELIGVIRAHRGQEVTERAVAG